MWTMTGLKWHLVHYGPFLVWLSCGLVMLIFVCQVHLSWAI